MNVQTRTRVLVVEDEPAIRKFLVDALEDEGYQVVAAANGAQALELLAAEPRRPDVIVLDMHMPAMDGIAFAEAYRQSPEPHAPIVVVTAYRTEGRQAASLGAEEVLVKPVELETLLEQVARHARTSMYQPPLLDTAKAALLFVAGLIGMAAAFMTSPMLAQARTPVVPSSSAERIETSSLIATAEGVVVRPGAVAAESAH